MKSYNRILTVQDVSCVGQCSLTVALPILSACGVETCVLPSAVLSTHTAGFKGFTFRDLSPDMPAILEHWQKENIRFDGFYTGYLGSEAQIDYCIDIFRKTGANKAVRVVDPAMADNGALYSIFDMNYVEAMKRLVAVSDVVIPNITEASFLTGIPYRTEYDEAYVLSLMKGLTDLGAGSVVLTGVGYREGKTGVAVYKEGHLHYYEHKKLPNSCHGTGDVYASAFMGALMRGKRVYTAAKIAADYTVRCIENTAGDASHWYGVKFEPVLPELISMLGD